MLISFCLLAGEDAEIKQLLWVIENLQEELHISNKSFGLAERQTQERQAIVDRLEVASTFKHASDLHVTLLSA